MLVTALSTLSEEGGNGVEGRGYSTGVIKVDLEVARSVSKLLRRLIKRLRTEVPSDMHVTRLFIYWVQSAYRVLSLCSIFFFNSTQIAIFVRVICSLLRKEGKKCEFTTQAASCPSGCTYIIIVFGGFFSHRPLSVKCVAMENFLN